MHNTMSQPLTRAAAIVLSIQRYNEFVTFSFSFPSLHRWSDVQFATKRIHPNHIDIIPVYGRAKNGYAVKQ